VQIWSPCFSESADTQFERERNCLKNQFGQERETVYKQGDSLTSANLVALLFRDNIVSLVGLRDWANNII
jgi:hypothetical protein